MMIGAGLFVAGSVAAVLLNFQGASCLTQLARLDKSAFSPGTVEEMERNCAIITNSYVYSLYAAVAGAIVLSYGYFRWRRRI